MRTVGNETMQAPKNSPPVCIPFVRRYGRTGPYGTAAYDFLCRISRFGIPQHS
jgi:hypothetical protein